MNISKPIAYAAAATIVVLIATVAYLIGRDSGRRQAQAVEPAPVAQQVAQQPPMQQAPLPSQPAKQPEPMFTLPPSSGAPLRIPQDSPATPTPAVPAVATSPEPPIATPVASTGNKEAIRSYFAQVASIQTVGIGDGNEFANTLLSSAMAGDQRGFDGVIASARAGQERLAKVAPPSECRAYHNRLTVVVDDGIKLMVTIQNAIKRSDSQALAAVASSAAMLKTRVEALEVEEKQIRARAGL
jgi:hypothetical protein